jgi:hypothetical protein
VAGRTLGGSSATARRRAMDDHIERVVQQITERIVQMSGK